MNQDILEGLKTALFKGETLNQAMKSFQNAGYDLKEIQEAARELQPNTQNQIPSSTPITTLRPTTPTTPTTTQTQNPQSTISQKPISQNPIKIQEKLKTNIIPIKKTIIKPYVQKVSDYEGSSQNPRKILMTLIIILLVILILGLVVIFLFREGILDFIESLFG